MTPNATAPASSLAAALAPVGAAPTPAIACRNCGGPVGEHYCGTCGQRHVEHADPTLREVFHDAAQEFLSVDGKIVGTLKRLVVDPGGLTAEHLSGRRARYIPPIRLYLTCSLLYFLLVSVTPWLDRDTYQRLGRDAASLRETAAVATAQTPQARPRTIGDVLRRGSERMSSDPAAVERAMNVGGPRLMFVLVPFFALLLKRAYRREGRRFPGHLYFALHLFSFYFLASVAQRLTGLPGIPWLKTATAWLLLAVMAVYIMRALERVFGTSRARAIRRTLLLLVQFVIAMGVFGTVMLFGMLGLE